MKHILFVLFLLVSLQSFGQFRDKCPDFTIRNKYIEHTAPPFGQWDYSIRHRQYEASMDFGSGMLFMPIPPAYSALPFTASAGLRLIEKDSPFMIHQNWIFQLKNMDKDTLFHTPNNDFVISAVWMDIGYEVSMPRNKCTQYYGIGTGGGNLYANQVGTLIFVSKTKIGVTHNTFLKFNAFWNTNNFMDLHDDNLYMGLSYGFYLDEESRYHR